MLDWGFSILLRLLLTYYGGMRDNLNLPHLIIVQLCSISEAGDSDAAAADAAAASPPAA